MEDFNEDEDDYNTVQRKKTINKIKNIIKEKNEEFQNEKNKEKEPKIAKMDKKALNAELRKSIATDNISFNNKEIKNKLDNLISDYLQKHKSKGYEKIPDYLDKKEDDSTLIKTCKYQQNLDKELPLIIIDNKFYDDFKSFLNNYIKYEPYKAIFKLSDNLILKNDNINNYSIFHKGQNKDFNSNIFFAETISTSLVNLYNEDQIKDIKNTLSILSNGFKDNYLNAIEKWVTVVYNSMTDYILFKMKNKPLYYCCDICKKPILFMEKSINNIIKENEKLNTDNNNNNDTIKINNDFIKKEIEIRKENDKKIITEMMSTDEGKNEIKKLINIANNISNLINFCQIDEKLDDNKPHFIANPPKLNGGQNVQNNSNVLFYDESKYADFELMEKNVSGAFIWAMDIKSLERLMEILNDKNEIKKFIFITSGKYCEKVLKFLNDKNYLNKLGSFVIFTKNDKFNNLKNQYNQIKGIFKTKKELIKYINEYNNPHGIFFTIKLINITKYNESYRSFHETLSSFYGESFGQTADLYKSKIKLFQEYVDSTHKGGNIITHLQPFEQNDMKGIINLYTSSAIYGDFNKWLYTLDELAYEKIGYFFASLMYNLNLYNETEHMGVKEPITLYRGMNLDFYNLLPYQNNIGNIITFPSFTSTTSKQTVTGTFTSSGNKNNFSISYIFKYNCKDEWIPTTIYVEKDSACKGEEERLFLPFSFYMINKVDIDIENCHADIELEAIGRKTVLENDIKNGKRIIYNYKEKVMEAY